MEFFDQLNDFHVYRRTNGSGPHSEYRFKYSLPFEKIDDPRYVTLLFQDHWSYTISISVVYYLVILGLQRFLRHRPPFDLSRPLFYWNASLAAFSVFALVRTSEDFFQSLTTYGAYRTLCETCHPNDVAAFWSLAFALSKFVELGDTLFIVLRKRPLIFLHYYHHAAVLIYTIHSGAEHAAPGRAFVFMNLVAHSLMYTYFALSAAGYKIPRWVAMCVTTVQTVQMLAGVGITISVYLMKTVYRMPCQQSLPNLYLAFTLYATFAVLFMQFFYRTYFAKSEKTVKKE